MSAWIALPADASFDDAGLLVLAFCHDRQLRLATEAPLRGGLAELWHAHREWLPSLQPRFVLSSTEKEAWGPAEDRLDVAAVWTRLLDTGETQAAARELWTDGEGQLPSLPAGWGDTDKTARVIVVMARRNQPVPVGVARFLRASLRQSSGVVATGERGDLRSAAEQICADWEVGRGVGAWTTQRRARSGEDPPTVEETTQVSVLLRRDEAAEHQSWRVEGPALQRAGVGPWVSRRTLEEAERLGLGGASVATFVEEEWSPRPGDGGEGTERLEPRMTADDGLGEVAAVIAQVGARNGAQIWMVGGVVRDLVLGRTSPDIDLVTNGDAVSLARSAAAQSGGEVMGHGAFGTACWLRDRVPSRIDLASARIEHYASRGALPEVCRATLAEDLARRDFTVNAMALELSADARPRLFDPYGGVADLRARVLRAMHPLSFQEDPTRIFRAARFCVRLGLGLAPATQLWMRAALEMDALRAISAERLGGELQKVFEESDALAVVACLVDWGVLASVYDGWRVDPSDWEVARRLLAGREEAVDMLARWREVTVEQVLWVWVSSTLGAAGAEVPAKLAPGGRRAQERFLGGVAAMRAVLDRLRGASRGEAGHTLGQLDAVECVVALALADSSLRELLLWWMREGVMVTVDVNGVDLLDAGVPAGPSVGVGMRAAWSAAWEGASRDEQLDRALEIVARQHVDSR